MNSCLQSASSGNTSTETTPAIFSLDADTSRATACSIPTEAAASPYSFSAPASTTPCDVPHPTTSFDVAVPATSPAPTVSFDVPQPVASHAAPAGDSGLQENNAPSSSRSLPVPATIEEQIAPSTSDKVRRARGRPPAAPQKPLSYNRHLPIPHDCEIYTAYPPVGACRNSCDSYCHTKQ